MTTRVTPIPADPWELIPRRVEVFVAIHHRLPTRVRIDRATEAMLEAASPDVDVEHVPLRSLDKVCGLTPEWDAERLEVV